MNSVAQKMRFVAVASKKPQALHKAPAGSWHGTWRCPLLQVLAPPVLRMGVGRTLIPVGCPSASSSSLVGAQGAGRLLVQVPDFPWALGGGNVQRNVRVRRQGPTTTLCPSGDALSAVAVCCNPPTRVLLEEGWWCQPWGQEGEWDTRQKWWLLVGFLV